MNLMRAAMLATLLVATSGLAQIQLGVPAPPFTKTLLNGGVVTLSQYRGKVVILNLLGWGCNFNVADGPSVQHDIQEYYDFVCPGCVQVLGVDLFNGTRAQLESFRTLTGTTYPLARDGNVLSGGDVLALYGEHETYVVVNRAGIVRYSSGLTWLHGEGYHLYELRSCIDSLMNAPPPNADAPQSPPAAFAFMAGPNPARGTVRVSLATPHAAPAVRVTVHDLAGRTLAGLWEGALEFGTRAWTWDTQDSRGRAVPAGVYLIRAEVGPDVRTLRVVVTR